MSLSQKTYESAKAGFKPLSRKTPLRSKSTLRGVSKLKTSTEKRGASKQASGRKTLNPIGKRGREWLKARAWLKRQFRYRGITTCMFQFPGCWFDEVGGFAHPAKRRNLKEGELWIAVPSCNVCHDKLELMPPPEMRSRVEAAFASTGIVPPPLMENSSTPEKKPEGMSSYDCWKERAKLRILHEVGNTNSPITK